MIDPQNEQVFWNMAIVHMEMRKYDRARDDLQKAIAVNAERGWLPREARHGADGARRLAGGQGSRSRRRSSSSRRCSRRTTSSRRSTSSSTTSRARSSTTPQSIEKGPRFLEAYSALGRLYADLGYLDQAVQVLTEALKVALPGTEEEAQVHHLLGTVLPAAEEVRRGSRASSAPRSSVVPGMRDALFSLGWTYELQGNKEEAKRYLQKFVDVAGAEAPAHYVKAARDKLSEMAEGF